MIAAAWLIVAGYASINAVVKAELFPTKVRATGVGLPYALTVSIFGGTAESIALVQIDWPRDVVLLLPDRGNRGLTARLRDHTRHEAALGHGSSRVGVADTCWRAAIAGRRNRGRTGAPDGLQKLWRTWIPPMINRKKQAGALLCFS